MAERACIVVIERGQARAWEYAERGAACIRFLFDGPDSAGVPPVFADPTQSLLDWGLAEGGYLLDLDERVLVTFGDPVPEDLAPGAQPGDDPLIDAFAEGPAAFLAALAASWPGWHLVWDDRGTDAFAEHLHRRGIHDLAIEPPTAPRNCVRHEVRA